MIKSIALFLRSLYPARPAAPANAGKKVTLFTTHEKEFALKDSSAVIKQEISTWNANYKALPKSIDLSPGRLETETFEEYKERRKMVDKMLKWKGKETNIVPTAVKEGYEKLLNKK